MRRRRSWSGSSIIRLCEALTHAHGRGVVHRDIKPENILLRKRYGAALLTDFGIMKMVGERAVTSFGSGPGAGTKGGGLDGVVKIAYSACRRQDRELATLQMT